MEVGIIVLGSLYIAYGTYYYRAIKSGKEEPGPYPLWSWLITVLIGIVCIVMSVVVILAKQNG